MKDEQVWVCLACGKMSHDQRGDRPISPGWDVSCFLNSILCRMSSLEIVDGRVKRIDEGKPKKTAKSKARSSTMNKMINHESEREEERTG